jgi:hypothetical protein
MECGANQSNFEPREQPCVSRVIKLLGAFNFKLRIKLYRRRVALFASDNLCRRDALEVWGKFALDESFVVSTL